MNAPWSQLVGRAATTSLLIGGPVAGYLTGKFAGWPTPIVIVVVLSYEALVATMALLTAVIADLRLRWGSRITDAVDAQLQRYVSRYGRAYRQYAINSNSFMDTKGLGIRGESPLHYDDVFISLSLDGTAQNHLNRSPVGVRGLEGVRRDIWSWLQLNGNSGTVLAIIGPPGSGKTTLIRHIALTLARGGWSGQHHVGPRKLPIIVALRDCSGLFQSAEGDEKNWSPPELPQMLRTSAPRIPMPEPPMWIERQLARGRLCIMLDGLDEMPAASMRLRLSRWVEQQAANYPRATFIVTSRPFGWRDNEVDPSIVLQVNPLEEAEAAQFIKRWYQATMGSQRQGTLDASRLAAEEGAADLLNRLGSNARILALTVNPLLLTLVVNVHYYRGALPGSRVELYNEVCDVFSGKRATAKGVRNPLTPSQNRLVLQKLAYDMMLDGLRDFTFDQVDGSISKVLSTVAKDTSTEEYLMAAQDYTGLVIEREAEIYSFSHHSFQEYLAACHVKESGNEAVLIAHVRETWWRETIRLYAAQVDGTKLVTACIKESETNGDASLMVLGAQIALEARALQESARLLLASRLDPPDARVNRLSRAMAGQVRAILRTGQLVPVGTASFASDSAVTNIEYQAFVDASGSEGLAPPHWVGGLFPDGQAVRPVTGLRPSSAALFCRWMTANLGREVAYRLPGSAEAKFIMQRVADLQVDAIWTAGLSRIVDEHGNSTEDVFPKLASYRGESNAFLESRWGSSALRRDVTGQLEIDASDPAFLASQTAIPTDQLREWISTVAAELVGDLCADVTGLNLDWFVSRMEAWTRAWPVWAEGSRFHVEVVTACKELRKEVQAYKDPQTKGQIADERTACQRARSALLLCAYAFDSLGREDTHLSARQRFLMAFVAFSRSRDSVLNYRDQALRAYYQMCLHETRLSGKSQGWEGFVPVTGARSTEFTVRIVLARGFGSSLMQALLGRAVSYRFDYSLATDPYRVIRSEVHNAGLDYFAQVLRVVLFVRPLTGRRIEMVPGQDLPDGRDWDAQR